MNSSRDKILNAVKEAAKIPSQLPDKPEGVEERIAQGLASITPPDYEALRDQFRKELEIVSGEFQLVKSKKEIVDAIADSLQKSDYASLAVAGDGLCLELAEQIAGQKSGLEVVKASDYSGEERKLKLAETPAALVDVTYAVADVASLAVIYDDTPSSLTHFLADTIFAVVRPEQLVANLFELFDKVPADKYTNMTLVTGPSRTADVEKILILGAHGPRRLVVFMLEE